MPYEWTDLSYLQKQASKVEEFRDLQQNPLSAFVLGAVLVFFVLAAALGGDPGDADVRAVRPRRRRRPRP
jgi:hypothetical protein